MKTQGNIRDYGYGDNYTVDGPPRFIQWLEHEGPSKYDKCPNCGCDHLAIMEFNAIKAPQLKGGGGVGTYVSCVACPWASPAIISAIPEPEP